jgi:hypothetical protein
MTITLKIDNPDIEQQLMQFVKQQKQDLEEVVLEAIKKLIYPSTKKKFNYVKRDPRKYSRKIEYDDDSTDDLSDVKPYSHVEDSGAYIRELRGKRNI